MDLYQFSTLVVTTIVVPSQIRIQLKFRATTNTIVLMKDYTASLKSYGIKDGSSLMLLSTPTESLPKPPTVEEVVKEQTPLEKAMQSLSQIEKSLIDLDTKFSILKNSIRNPTMTPIQKIDYQARELQELLMKLLLKLDAVQFDDDGVRSLRKDIVKRVQLKLNESDELKIQVGMLKKPSL